MARPSAVRTTTTATSRRSGAIRHHHDGQVFVPGPRNRKENKPLDQGARFEHETMVEMRTQGIDAWRNPGIRGQRVSDKGLVADYGVRLAALEGIVDPVIPEVSGRPAYNAIGSNKTQTVAGSAEHKIGDEIVDMAWAADRYRVVPFVIIDSPVFTPGQLARWKSLGELEMVVVLTAEELRAGRLPQALVVMAKRRRRMYARLRDNGSLPPRRGSYRFTNCERRYNDRRQQHRAARLANELLG